jgi:hypothetical protein
MNWNYISGFFDADGYITMSRPHKNQNKTVYVGFTNIEESILVEIKDFILNNIGVKGSISKKSARKENHSDSYDLKYLYNNALKVIEMIDTHHPKKSHRKNIVIEQYKKLTPRNGKYTDEIKEKREKMIESFFSH